MPEAPAEITILSPGLPQSLAIADILLRGDPGLRALGYPLPGERHHRRPPFLRYVAPEEGEAACRNGTAVITGSTSTRHVLARRPSIRLGQVDFERRNLCFYDKPATLRRAGELGIPVPRTWACVEEAAGYRGPVFYKPSQEGTDGPRRRVRSLRDLPPVARNGGYLLQELIPGRSVVGFAFLADRGRVIASRLHHEVFSIPRDGGSAVMVEETESPRAEELSMRLISDFGYSGWGLVEFKPCERRGDLVLMELNAKFWASLEFTLRTQPLFPRLLFGVDAKKEPIRRMFWPSRLLRGGLAGIPSGLARTHGATPSRERLTWRDWARSVFPGTG